MFIFSAKTSKSDVLKLLSDQLHFSKTSFFVHIEECLQYYTAKSDGFRHVSVHTTKTDCEKNHGFWVSFSNYLEEYPKHQTKQECEKASTDELPLKWAIPYRSEDIDNLKMDGDDVESLKRCLVALAPPECMKTPHTRTNHLGNAKGVIPFRYKWVIPYFPSGHVQRCILRLRFVERLYRQCFFELMYHWLFLCQCVFQQTLIFCFMPLFIVQIQHFDRRLSIMGNI